MTIDGDLFREIMSTFPSGVAIVTAVGEEGKPRGLTVSAFCPVSLDPPLVLVCIDKASNSLAAIRRSGGFTVNLLAAGREDLARRYASKLEDKFEGVSTGDSAVAEAGPVLLDDCVAWAACRVHSAVEAGDHYIIVGQVEDGAHRAGEVPLLYGRRVFTDWAAHLP
ncbi:MAG TPA: flavin reductase family protein [Actinomycetota bacterium]|jgi:flavin reductase (DIM6/NTAB) family NADH-FMN oxidoreductase RutF